MGNYIQHNDVYPVQTVYSNSTLKSTLNKVSAFLHFQNLP